MIFDRILVAVDGSVNGQIAANYGFLIAGKLGSSLTAQHVVDPRLIRCFLDPEFGKELGLKASYETEKRVFNALRRIGNTVLDLFRQEAHQREVNVSTSLDEGRVVDRIVEYSSRFDLLVIGHHGSDSGDTIERIPLGSVAERVTLKADLPVLIAIQPLSQIENVVVAYDGSEAGRGALLMAENFAKEIGAMLKVVTVARNSEEMTKAELLVEDGQKFLREEWNGGVFSIKEGEVGETILREAQAVPNSLLVLGAYGYKDPEENVLGSTTTKVIRNMKSSVLIFRPVKMRKDSLQTRVSVAQNSI